MKFKDSILPVTIALSALVIALFAYISIPKIAYVNVQSIYDEFEMKKELSNKYHDSEFERKMALDSLEIQLNIIGQKIREDGSKNPDDLQLFESKRQEYLFKKKKFDEVNLALSSQYDKQILEQLTQYITDFGKSENYDLLLGANNNSSVLYGEESSNATQEAIGFVNKKYLGRE